MRRLGFLVRKEFQELRRNPRMFPVIFVAPVLQLFILGYAATTDVKNVPMMVVDADRSAASRDLVERFDASPYFTIVDVTTDDANVTRAIGNTPIGPVRQAGELSDFFPQPIW